MNSSLNATGVNCCSLTSPISVWSATPEVMINYEGKRTIGIDPRSY